jgi:hypothetical protein
MFKYYISIPFHCFTQYYEIEKRYHKLLYRLYKLSIFLCALYKKGGVGDSCPDAGIHPGVPLPEPVAVHCLVRFDRSGYDKNLN